MRKFILFLSLNHENKCLLIEAYVLLAWGRLLKWVSFSKIAPHLGEEMGETSFISMEKDKRLLNQISQNIHLACKYTFWESSCLVKAFAARSMLHRRGIDSTLYLGTGVDEKGKLIAHAWLRSGPYFITGSEGKERFTVVATFANKVSSFRSKVNEYK